VFRAPHRGPLSGGQEGGLRVEDGMLVFVRRRGERRDRSRLDLQVAHRRTLAPDRQGA
jgi:hypothetical protein